MIAGLEKHLTQLGWDFVVSNSVQHLGGQTWYFCIKCFGDIFCVFFFVIFFYKSSVNAMGH
jgi:hypothetical protein